MYCKLTWLLPLPSWWHAWLSCQLANPRASSENRCITKFWAMNKSYRDMVQMARHKLKVRYPVHIYLKYHSDCPLVRIGTTPPPLPQAVCVPPRNKRGAHSPASKEVGGGGSQFGRLEKKLSTLPTLCEKLFPLFFLDETEKFTRARDKMRKKSPKYALTLLTA